MRKRNIAALCATMAALCATLAAYAQDGHHGNGHAENHDWYRELKQPGTGYSCCNGTTADREGDCRPTLAEFRDGQWFALLDGTWVPIPPRVVIDPKFNKEPIRAHICASKSGMIYCFLGAGDAT